MLLVPLRGEGLAREVNEDVFEAGWADGDGVDEAGQGFDDAGDELGAGGVFQADVAIERFGIEG